MLNDFNLLVSSARGNETEANSELRYLIGELGDRSLATDYTPVSGLTVAKTQLDPFWVVDQLKSILKKRPWEFRYVLKIKPIARVVSCEIEQITGAAMEQASTIADDETFRVALEKRQNKISSKTVIDAVAAKIPRKVDLRNPKKIVLVEVIGEVAGISVIEARQILGVEREKKTPSPARPAELTSQSPTS